MTTFFLSVYDFFARRKGALFVVLSLLIIAFAFLAYNISFQEDISRFLPAGKDNKRIADAYKHVVSANTIIVYCRTDGRNQPDERQTDAIDALAERLTARMDSTYIKSIFYEVDAEEMMAVSEFIVKNMPYFLDESDYRKIDSLLSRDAIARQLAADREILTSEAGRIIAPLFLADPLQITSPLIRRLQTFKVGDQFKLYDDHIFSADNQGLMFIECALPASETKANAVFIDSLRAYMAEVEKRFEGVSFYCFGAAEIGITNARQIRNDTLFSMSLAIIIVFALLIYAFRSWRKIALIFISVAFGGIFALAALSLISGEASVIAVGVSSIMFGIAINYPLHFIEHHSRVARPRRVIKDIIEPLTIGNLTTVGAFMSLVLIGSDAMSDLGLFASLLLVGTILFVLFFLPHLLPASANAESPRISVNFQRLRSKLPSVSANQFAIAVIILTIVFIIIGGSGGSRFDTDMQAINYMTDKQRQSFDNMMGLLNKNRRVVYHVSEGDTREAALEANEANAAVVERLLDNGAILSVSGVGGFYPSRKLQAERIRLWNDFWSSRRDSVINLVGEESRKAGFAAAAFSPFVETLGKEWETAGAERFSIIGKTLAKNYVVEQDGKTIVVNLLYADPTASPDDVLEIEKTINQSSPSAIAFDAGTITRRMIESLSDSFNYVLYICGFIVFVFLVFSLGRIELSIIAFAPLALSWVWILGLMTVFDVRFNIVNIILATFIFGQGDDYTIFMTEGLMYEYAYRRKTLASYKKSIALSALVMFVGMGMLIFARHPALRSLAEVTVVGMTSVVVMSYLFPPLLFRLLTMRKGQKRLMPVTLKNLFCFAYAFLFFLAASLAITVVGRLLFASGRATERNKLRYHRLLCGVARFVVKRIPQVKTTFVNATGETFQKPGVIICNHQSHLDIMCIMMLAPKIIIITNDWVWNSPFYGRLIKYADYYPASEGLNNMLDRLSAAIEQGYSIMIFPEGTRSADCSIKRFHRGAFYIAGKLNLDIIPVMIHGVGHVLPKNEFMPRKGAIHIQVMPRITPDNNQFGHSYSSRATAIRRYYADEYRKIGSAVETPAYYADLVIKNYIYKGAAIEREVRRNLRRSNNYAALIAQIPDEGCVVIRNCGYGEYPLLLALVKKNLRIIAVIPDPDKRELAANCASVPQNLEFVEST